MARHRHQEFIRFLNRIEAAVPAGKLVHAILDNWEMLAFAHIPTGTATNHGFEIDDVNGRLIEPAVTTTAIGADIETGRVTP
jgi:hypothetical protein